MIERSRYGYYLFATRDNEDGARSVGVQRPVIFDVLARIAAGVSTSEAEAAHDLDHQFA